MSEWRVEVEKPGVGVLTVYRGVSKTLALATHKNTVGSVLVRPLSADPPPKTRKVETP